MDVYKREKPRLSSEETLRVLQEIPSEYSPWAMQARPHRTLVDPVVVSCDTLSVKCHILHFKHIFVLVSIMNSQSLTHSCRASEFVDDYLFRVVG